MSLLGTGIEIMATAEYLDELHVRILRVTEDLRRIQRDLNCAAMEVPGNTELMEALTQVSELETMHVLQTALDQMRRFLWFYMQVMTNQCEAGEHLRQSLRPPSEAVGGSDVTLVEKFKQASDAAILRYLSDGKTQKPN
jgi:hypothetical protein